MLFSEPKIPQWQQRRRDDARNERFSALQRAENSSIGRGKREAPRLLTFQCSSASRKFLNCRMCLGVIPFFVRFQCSSASRKFLNRVRAPCRHCVADVSVLFSEPKIPQSHIPSSARLARSCFSALQRAENSSIITDHAAT